MHLSEWHNVWMRISSPDAAWPMFLEAVVGMAIGAMIGLLVRILRRQPLNGGVILDGLLGAIGFVGGAIGSLLVPYKENTVTMKIGDTIVRETTRRYQHPYQVAFLAAIALPVIWELLRYLRARRATVSK